MKFWTPTEIGVYVKVKDVPLGGVIVQVDKQGEPIEGVKVPRAPESESVTECAPSKETTLRLTVQVVEAAFRFPVEGHPLNESAGLRFAGGELSE